MVESVLAGVSTMIRPVAQHPECQVVSCSLLAPVQVDEMVLLLVGRQRQTLKPWWPVGAA